MSRTIFRFDSSTRTGLFAAILLAGSVLAVYSPAPLGGFVWDDHSLIVNQARSLGQASWSDVFLEPFFPPSDNNASRNFYRPLTKASFVADLRLWGLSPAGFHLTNVSVHVLNTLILFALLLKLGASTGISFGVAAAFGVAPRLSEAVAWISGRTDVLAGLFCLLALLVSARHVTTTSQRCCSALFVLLGLLSKESALAGAVAIIVHEWPNGDARRASRLARLAPVGAALLLYASLRLSSMSGVLAAGIRPLPLPQRVIMIVEALGRYLWMLAVPWMPETQIGIAGQPSWPFVSLGLAALPFALLALWRASRHAELRVGLSLLAVPLALVILVPLPLNVVAADRYLYLPLAGLALMGARAFDGRQIKRMVALPAATAALGSLSFATFHQIDTWRSDISLWMPRVARDDATSHDYERLADALTMSGRPAEALPLLDRAEELAKRFDERHGWSDSLPGVLQSKALALFALERYDQAEVVFRELVQAYPRVPEFHRNLAACIALQLRLDEALLVLQSAPASPSVRALAHSIAGFLATHQSPANAEAASQQQRKLLATIRDL